MFFILATVCHVSDYRLLGASSLFHDPYLSQQSCKKMEDAARLRVQYLLAISQNDVVRQQLNIADFIRFPLPLPLPLILSTVLNRLS